MPRKRSLAPYIPIGMIAVVTIAVIVALSVSTSDQEIRGSLTTESSSSEAQIAPLPSEQDACAVDAVGVTCRCVIRGEAECGEMGGVFFSRISGGIEACEALCAADENILP